MLCFEMNIYFLDFPPIHHKFDKYFMCLFFFQSSYEKIDVQSGLAICPYDPSQNNTFTYAGKSICITVSLYTD